MSMEDEPNNNAHEEDPTIVDPPPTDLVRNTSNTSNGSTMTYGLGSLGLDDTIFRSPMEDLLNLVAGAGAALASKYSTHITLPCKVLLF